MRITFARTLAQLGDSDPRIVLLTADLGFMALDDFIARHPSRFFNVGVAEQNMVGVATGLAEAGFIPFVYSIVPFATLRPYEFIRNGPVLHRLPVRVVGVGAGVDYGTNGLTHYGLEDIAVMRAQPGMMVLAPAEAAQAAAILRATWNRPEPIYFRLGKDEKLTVPGLNGHFGVDEVSVVREGRDALLLTTSTISAEAVVAADALEASGISATVAVVAQLAPLPRQHLVRLLNAHPVVVSVENHYPNGGLGTLVAELIAEEQLPCRLVRRGLEFRFDGRSGSTQHLHSSYRLTGADIARDTRVALGRLG